MIDDESNVGLDIIIDWVWCKFSEQSGANNIEFDQVRSIDFIYRRVARSVGTHDLQEIGSQLAVEAEDRKV